MVIIPAVLSQYETKIFIENCPLLGYYAASSGNFWPTFRANLSVPFWRIKNPIYVDERYLQLRILSGSPYRHVKALSASSLNARLSRRDFLRFSYFRFMFNLSTNPCMCLCCNFTVNRRTYTQLRQDIFLKLAVAFLIHRRRKKTFNSVKPCTYDPGFSLVAFQDRLLHLNFTYLRVFQCLLFYFHNT